MINLYLNDFYFKSQIMKTVVASIVDKVYYVGK